MIRKALTYLFVTPLLLAASCISEDGTKCPETDVENMTLSLKLDMGLEASTGTRSRAGDKPSNYEPSIGNFEKISTVRVIILRNGREIEGARRVATADNGTWLNDNLKFKVRSNETKTILLIANEDALPAPEGSDKDTAKDFLDQFLTPGVEIKPEQWKQLTEWKVSMTGENIQGTTRGLFSNAKGEYPDYGLPLTEQFDVYASTALASKPTSDTYTQEVVLFLTRAAAKARFHFYVDDLKNNPNNPYLGKGLYVTGIRLNGLDKSEYVFPNGASYSPEKYLTNDIENPIPNVVDNAERYITSFTPVPNAEKFDFILDTSGEEAIEIKSYNAEIPMRGPIYFPESMCATTEQNYTVQVRVGTLTNPGEWITAQKEDGALLDNILNVDGLDAIARNTCLDINIFFGEPGITWKVSIVPYVGITLRPSFGEILDRNNQN